MAMAIMVVGVVLGERAMTATTKARLQIAFSNLRLTVAKSRGKHLRTISRLARNLSCRKSFTSSRSVGEILAYSHENISKRSKRSNRKLSIDKARKLRCSRSRARRSTTVGATMVDMGLLGLMAMAIVIITVHQRLRNTRRLQLASRSGGWEKT